MWCPFFFGQDNLLGGQFWEMSKFDFLGGQSNLPGGQMPTQLTCYLLVMCLKTRFYYDNFLKKLLVVLNYNLSP